VGWPTTVIATNELVTAAHLNLLPIRLGEVVLGSTAATIDFSSIPAIYSHLTVVGSVRSSVAAAAEACYLRMNGDTTATYQRQHWYARGTLISDTEELAVTRLHVANAPGASAIASSFAAVHLTIDGYSSTTRQKSVHGDWCDRRSVASGNTYAGNVAGEWRSTAAINQITFSLAAGSFVAGSIVSLYGWT
jgi:hypothetical protein